MTIMPEERAKILVEALPYIQEYTGQIIVVKYGGNAMTSEELKQDVIKDIVLLNMLGIHVVLVHGGGPEISAMLKKIGHESKFINGLRYTDQVTMDIVQQILCGKVNKNLVSLLDKAGGHGVGLGGMDGGLFRAVKKVDPDGTDYGQVGDIVEVHPEIVTDLLAKGYIPVVSSVAAGMNDDENFNINADTAAEKLAVALHAKKLILLTDVKGLLRDPKDDSTLIPELKVSQVPALITQGIISGGMIPKVDCCVEAVRQGVERANIQDGRVPHSILIELLSSEGVGTMFS
ncbi:MAG: acetylglutamate kinase [Bacillota bacterium]|uniref:Acetylglutamate kinase n=1 Tax=[Clostridium] aminophilum TaxID=1526 RepID=A0A1I0DWY5_9FIRM|nr:acetylglutamate kinase [[Clostridium] aminophilum]MDT3843601.1 acetylglutamate kinase [Bacillota bacterium]SET37216.1 N-acetylglutamate kinase [[Clostridium] aminophilum]SFR85745.1 N-acetylglutamate kinase [[Clostridium] aminophilum]